MAARKPARRATSGSLFWFTSLLFFISGGTGLVYQVIWFKRFGHVWGSSSLAFAAVGGSFLFGLGLGAYVLGKRADSVASPIRWYGVCELLIGLFALAIPFEIALLSEASAGLYPHLAEQPLARYLVQFGTTLLVLGPPCFLMGGTLPLLIRQLTSRDGALDEATGWLYAINTFGAAAGCYLAGFHLLPSLGMMWGNTLTASVNILIGLVALLYSQSSVFAVVAPRKNAPAAQEADLSLPWTPRLAGIYLAAALSGCAALVLEMTWSRQLALVLGGSTYAYTATLFVVLTGIATGSLVFHLYLRSRANSPWLPLAVVGLMMLGVVAGIWLLPKLCLALGPADIRAARGDQLWNGLICAAASAAVELIPAIGMGILFPLFVHLTEASPARVGHAVGNVYAWNTAGSILGATFTAVLLFPAIGTAGATALAVGMYLVSLLAILPWQGSGSLARLSATVAGGVAAIALVLVPADPKTTNLGFCLYGDPGDNWQSATQTLFFQEGASSNVLVSKSPPALVSLRVNGKVDASNGGDMATQIGLAYLPLVFKPDARELLVIGFGSGCTPGHCLQFPDTRVTCCELEPAVYAAAEHFAEVNHNPQHLSREWLLAQNAALPAAERLSAEEIDRQARFKMVFGDGRTAIQGSDKQYDIIISEPSNPWVAGCSNLFTKEFFAAARNRLTDGGVLAQWIQTYNFTLDDYLLIVRTMRSEFPYCGVMTLSGGSDTLLLASNQPLLPTPEKIASLQQLVDASPHIRAELDAWFGQRDLRYILLRHYLAGRDDLDTILRNSGSDAINSDVNLRLEFDAPLQVFKPHKPEELAMYSLLEKLRDARPAWVAKLAREMGLKASSAELFATLGDMTLEQAAKFEVANLTRGPIYQAYLQQAGSWYELAAKAGLDAKALELHRRRAALMFDSKTDRIDALNELLTITPNSAETHASLAAALMARGRQREAAEHYREALRLQPELAVATRTYLWANNLAWMLATTPDDSLRNGEEALRWARSAQQVAGANDWYVLDTLAAALAETGDYDEAIKVSERLLDHYASDPDMRETIQQRIDVYRASQPFRESPPTSG